MPDLRILEKKCGGGVVVVASCVIAVSSNEILIALFEQLLVTLQPVRCKQGVMIYLSFPRCYCSCTGSRWFMRFPFNLALYNPSIFSQPFQRCTRRILTISPAKCASGIGTIIWVQTRQRSREMRPCCLLHISISPVGGHTFTGVYLDVYYKRRVQRTVALPSASHHLTLDHVLPAQHAPASCNPPYSTAVPRSAQPPLLTLNIAALSYLWMKQKKSVYPCSRLWRLNGALHYLR